MWIGVVAFLFSSCGGDDVEPVNCETSGPIISLGIVTDAESCSVANGSIRVSASGGKEPYEFFLNEGAGQASGEFSNVNAGIYRISVKDGNRCEASVDNVTVKAADFTFTTNITSDNSCLDGNGEVIVSVNDGNPPYTYSLGLGPFTDNNVFSGLQSGSHAISVKDNNDCSVTLSVTVTRGITGTSWQNEIRPIMETSCALSGCHNGSSRPDLRIFANAKSNASSIKSRTQDRSMPREGTLTQQQIDIIACWVDDGAPNN